MEGWMDGWMDHEINGVSKNVKFNSAYSRYFKCQQIRKDEEF